MLLLQRCFKVLRFVRDSWTNSAFIKTKSPSKGRLWLWIDQIYWYIRYGNDFNDYCTFKFWSKSSSERKTYISYRRNDTLRRAFSTPEVYNLFLDKALFNKCFEKYVKRGWLITQNNSLSKIDSFIKEYNSVIAKPLKDFGGHGVIKLSINNSDFDEKWLLLKQKIEKGEDYILEQTIENIDYIKKLAPSSLNTIRLVTVIDNKGELHIIAALLRMGNGIAVTDNYHDGGMACPIDIETGSLCKTAYGMNCIEYDTHPFSKITFMGYKIPDFAKCVEIVEKVAYLRPEARYVGWDFAITPMGIELLEGNIPPGEDITQIATGKGMWYEMLEWK